MKKCWMLVCGLILVLCLSACGACEHEFVFSTSNSPTCTVEGSNVYKCTHCGEERVEAIAKSAHTFNAGEITTAPTCTAEGVKTYTCTGCGVTKTESVSTSAHTYDNGKVTKAATCTAEGVKTYTCTGCSATKTEAVAKVSHSYTGKVTKAATCSATGIKTHTCSKCGNSYTETLAAIGHNYSAATCTSPKICTRCGSTQGSALGHTGSGSNCDKCGQVLTLRDRAKVGQYIKFGAYEQDNNLANGKEEIEWLVLAIEGNKALVISKYILDWEPYDKSEASWDIAFGYWHECTLRTWLNETFINTAFTSTERSQIALTTLLAERNPDYNTPSGETCQDRVFMLSISEARKYIKSNAARSCTATAYARGQGAEENRYITMNGISWWLRSPGFYEWEAAWVSGTGSVVSNGSSPASSQGVRPAMWITLD